MDYMIVKGSLVKVHCWFCSKASDNVDKMVLGVMNVAICDACVDTCVEIIADSRKKEATAIARTDDAVREDVEKPIVPLRA